MPSKYRQRFWHLQSHTSLRRLYDCLPKYYAISLSRLSPKSEAPKEGHAKIFRNHEITGKGSICSNQMNWIENKRNLLIDLQYLSSCRLELQTIISRYLSSNYHASFLGTKKVSSIHARNFKKVNKSRWQERCDRNHKCISSWSNEN